MVGETPRTTCRKIGRKDSAPNMANPAVKPTAELTENTGLRNSRSGSTGSAARRADHHQPTASTTAATPRPQITGEPHE